MVVKLLAQSCASSCWPKGCADTRALCGVAVGVLQVREEEIEAAHREQVQKRSASLLASKANKFATIHTEQLKTYRQLAAAKVCRKPSGCGACCTWSAAAGHCVPARTGTLQVQQSKASNHTTCN
jgi:hypothetical protein